MPLQNVPDTEHPQRLAERLQHVEQELADCKQQIEALRKNEEHLSQSQQMACLGSWEADVKAGALTVSSGYRHVFGIDPSDTDISPDSLLDRVHPDDRDEVLAAYRRAIHEKIPYDGTHRIMRLSDGEIRYFHERWEPVVDDAGQVIRIIGIIQDITERKRMELELEKETRRRKILMAGSRDGIVILNPGQNHTVVEANRRFTDMLGYTPEELLTLHPWDWDAVMSEEEIRTRFPVGVSPKSVIETRHRRKDGTEFDVEVSSSWDMVDGELLSLCICRDITERKRMERALEKEMRQRDTLMAGYRDGIAIINESRDYRVVKANRRFAEMLGYTPEELLALHAWEWEATMSEADIRAVFPANRPDQHILFETRHRRKDGTEFDVEICAYWEWVDGEKLSLTICRDITERKRIAEELRQYRVHLEELVQARTTELTQANGQLRRAKEDAEAAQRTAETANRLKTEFLANLSHEIRTPLNAVLGFAGVLEPHLTDPEPQHYLNLIEEGARSLLSLMNDILDLAKTESGMLELHPEPVDLRRLIANVTSMFQAEIFNKELTLQIEIAPEIPQILVLDRLRLRQVLFNILGNAVKFTEQGEIQVSVSGKQVPVSREPGAAKNGRLIPEDCVLFTVKDTGIGIPADQQQCIFEAFRQLDGQRTRRYGGTGLGLALTKRLVDMMGGTIAVSSEVGQGSRFEVVLRQVSPPHGAWSDDVTPCPEPGDAGLQEAEPPVSAEFLLALLQGLIPLVHEGDLDALHSLDQRRRVFNGTPFEQDFRLLENQLLQYGFEDASATLARLERKLQAFQKSGTP